MNTRDVKSKPSKEKKLTDKEELFCQYYIKCLNATKAATKAKYSENAAAEIGYENLRKLHIKARISQLLKDNIGEDTLEDVLSSHLKNLALFNINDFLDQSGEIDPEKIKEYDLPGVIKAYSIKRTHDPETGKVIQSSITINAVDQLKAVEQLVKLKKLTDDSININNFILSNASEEDMKI